MKQLFSYLALIIVCCSCENDMNAVRAFDKNKMGVEQAYDVETIMSQTAHVKGVLTAPYMERHVTSPAYTEFPNSLRVVFYNDSLIQTSILTANYGKMDEKENNIYLRDSVVFISYFKGVIEKERLDCKELKWDDKRKLFISNSLCRVVSFPADTLYGQGLEANQDFSWWQFINSYGSFLPPDSIANFN